MGSASAALDALVALDPGDPMAAYFDGDRRSQLAALAKLRRTAPGRLVIAEWNYCLENVLAETSTEFVFGVRQAAAAFVDALRLKYTVAEAPRRRPRLALPGRRPAHLPGRRAPECFLPADGALKLPVCVGPERKSMFTLPTRPWPNSSQT
jgi:hypothetical protein